MASPSPPGASSRYVPSHNSRQAGIKDPRFPARNRRRLPRNEIVSRFTGSHTRIRAQTSSRFFFFFQSDHFASGDSVRRSRGVRSLGVVSRNLGRCSLLVVGDTTREKFRSATEVPEGGLRDAGVTCGGRRQVDTESGSRRTPCARREYTQGTRAHLALRRRATVRYRRGGRREERRKRSRRGREER